MNSEGWAQYAEYARRLDAARAEELARTAGMREGVAVMSAHADDLQARLNGQGGMLLGKLAPTLRVRRPKLTPIPPEGFVEPSTTLAQVGRAIDLGDVEARRADERGRYPALFPTMSAQLRSLVVYGAAAVLILLVQLLGARPLLRTTAQRAATPSHDPSALKYLFVVPMIGFAIAYLVLAVGSRSRVSQPNPVSYSRLGLVLCLGIGPLAVVIYVASAYSSR